MTYLEALIHHTAEGWIDNIDEAAHSEIVNFWTSDLRNYRLELGAPFFFKRARSGAIVGYGVYHRKVEMTNRGGLEDIRRGKRCGQHQ